MVSRKKKRKKQDKRSWKNGCDPRRHGDLRCPRLQYREEE